MGSTGRDVHIDTALSNVAIAYRPEGFIADQIAPQVPVAKQHDLYYVWDKADAFRTEDDKRAPGTEANIITRSMSSESYFCDNYALKDSIPWEDVANADKGFVFTERGARIEGLKDKLLLNWEYRVGKQVTSGSNVGSYSAVASAWTTYSTNSDPIGDIKTAILNVEDSTGYKPNSIIFGGYAWRHFREHAEVIKRIYGDSAGPGAARIVTRDQTKAIFELERILVGGAYYNSADEGQTIDLSQIWHDNVLVYFAPMNPRRDKPSFMYSFRWDKVRGLNMAAEIHVDSKKKADEVELGYYQDEKITSSELGFLITGVGSSQ